MNIETKDALDFLEKEVRESSVLLDGEFTTLMFSERTGMGIDESYRELKRRKDVVMIGKKRIDGSSSNVWRLK